MIKNNLGHFFVGHRYRIAIIIAIAITAFMFITGLILLRGKAFGIASDFVRSNPTLSSNLGRVVDVRISFASSIRINGTTGEANYKLHVTGEKGKGIVYLSLVKKADVWSVTGGSLVLSNKKRINLQGEEGSLSTNQLTKAKPE